MCTMMDRTVGRMDRTVGRTISRCTRLGGSNGINCSYIYLFDSDFQNSKRLGELSNEALSSDFSPLGFGDFCHLTGYNVAYGDGHGAGLRSD